MGIFFVTQSPTDVPDDVLAQLGSRVQHQLRAHTPKDAKALKATVETYPTSHYDLAETLQALGIGEAIVTVLNPNGAPNSRGLDADAGATGVDEPAGSRLDDPGRSRLGDAGQIRPGDQPRLGLRMLTRKLEEGRAKAEQDAQAAQQAKEQAQAERQAPRTSAPRTSTRPAPKSGVRRC